MLIPPHCKIHYLDIHKLEELKKTLTTWLGSNCNIPYDSLYGTPILFAQKKMENLDFVLTIEH